MLSIYQHDPLRGLALLDQAERGTVKPVHRLSRQLLRGLCGAAALSCARDGRAQLDTERLRRQVRSTALQLDTRSTRGFAHVLEAACAIDAGEYEAAARELALAASKFEELSMSMLAAAARRRLGELSGGQPGRDLVAAADQVMRAQAVENPDAMTELLCPGCRSS